MANIVISRGAARTQGLKRYFTAEPCKRGHIAERHVSNLTCMECQREKTAARYPDRDPVLERQRLAIWRSANREKVNAASRAANATSERKAYKSAWFQANKQRIQAKPRNDSAANVASAKRWAKANPEKASEYFRLNTRKRRAQKKNSGGTHTAADLAEIMNAQGHRCAYCSADLRIVTKHVDHIMPFARGGSNGRENLQYLCRPCNQSKGARDPVAHAQSIGLLV